MELIGARASLFPELKARVYWSFAAISPLAAPVRAVVDGWHRRLAEEGVATAGAMIAARDAARRELAGALGGAPEDYALTQGTTASVVTLARSLRWRAGDRVALFDDEFPTNVVPWREAAADHHLGVDVFAQAPFGRDPDAALDALERDLAGRGVRVVAVSAVAFQSGVAMPLTALAEVCHRHRALLVVDAIQAAGIAPLDLARSGVDAAVGGGHKWALGTDGAGWIYVAPRAREAFGPSLAGWLSFEHPARFLTEPDRLHDPRVHLPAPRVFEGGSIATAAHLALTEGLRLCTAAAREGSPPGGTVAFDHVQALHDRIEPVLVERGFASERSAHRAARSGILAARPPAGVGLQALQAALARRGIVVTIPDGRLRLAPHFASTFEEAEVLASALPEAISEARQA